LSLINININIGAEGARSLAAALDTNRMLQHLTLNDNNIYEVDDKNIVGDRLRVNKLVLEVTSWVASAEARRVELWDDTLVLPPALAARAAVLAFGDELLDLVLPDDLDLDCLSPGGRDLAAAYLLPRAGRAAPGAPAEQVQRLADAAKTARHGQNSSSSDSRAL
jgi:hypothetical protein